MNNKRKIDEIRFTAPDMMSARLVSPRWKTIIYPNAYGGDNSTMKVIYRDLIRTINGEEENRVETTPNDIARYMTTTTVAGYPSARTKRNILNSYGCNYLSIYDFPKAWPCLHECLYEYHPVYTFPPFSLEIPRTFKKIREDIYAMIPNLPERRRDFILRIANCYK